MRRRKGRNGNETIVDGNGLAVDPVECTAEAHCRRVGHGVRGGDGVSDALPGSGIEGWPMPVHQCGLAGIGLHLLDNLRLDRLSDACARNERWAFHFVASPLRVAKATGSPVNPIATL